MKKAFVIGDPIAHSRSPLIHRTWLDTLGIKGSYDAIEITPDALAGFIESLRSGDYAGGNVTIPHKEAVIGLIDEIDPLAKTIGAVNTLVVREGRIMGSNTDYIGFLANLDAGAPGWDQDLETAIVLGAGGASRAILAGLIDRGIKDIHLLNRSLDRAQALAQIFGPAIKPRGLESFAAIAPRAGLLVNTSAVGMGGTRFESIDPGALKPGAVVTDIVYTPLITPLLADAAAKGFHHVDGLGMLLHQAVPGFDAWFGTRPQVTPDLREALLAAL